MYPLQLILELALTISCPYRFLMYIVNFCSLVLCYCGYNCCSSRAAYCQKDDHSTGKGFPYHIHSGFYNICQCHLSWWAFILKSVHLFPLHDIILVDISNYFFFERKKLCFELLYCPLFRNRFHAFIGKKKGSFYEAQRTWFWSPMPAERREINTE